MRRFWPVRVLAATALVLAAACGSSARDGYVAKLNAACRDFASREQKIGEPQTAADVRARGEEVAALFDDAIDGPVSRLHPPAQLADLHAALLAVDGQMSRNLHRLAGAARAGNGLAPLAAENRQLNERSNALAKRIGARDCG
jgi:hypothetical protein